MDGRHGRTDGCSCLGRDHALAHRLNVATTCSHTPAPERRVEGVPHWRVLGAEAVKIRRAPTTCCAHHAILRVVADRNDMGTLFDPEPLQWGLRGDPHVWRTMRDRFADIGRPTSSVEGASLLREAFREVVKVDVDDRSVDEVYLPEADVGGMSAGLVSLPAWRQRLLPLLEVRLGVAGEQADCPSPPD
jgi:hypothetical protein